MYSTLVITENINHSKAIEIILKKDTSFQFTDLIASTKIAEHFIKRTNYSLIIIELTTQNQEHVYKWLRNNSKQNFEIIILHDAYTFPNQLLEYRLNAFIDTKSIGIELVNALKRTSKKLIIGLEKDKRLENLLKVVSQKKNSIISLPVKDGLRVINSNDIISISALNSYSEVKLISKNILKVNKTINEFETLTQDLGFFRTHRSHIINLQHIKQLIKKNGGHIIMQDSLIIPLSVNKKTNFYQALRKFTLYV